MLNWDLVFLCAAGCLGGFEPHIHLLYTIVQSTLELCILCGFGKPIWIHTMQGLAVIIWKGALKGDRQFWFWIVFVFKKMHFCIFLITSFLTFKIVLVKEGHWIQNKIRYIGTYLVGICIDKISPTWFHHTLSNFSYSG